MKRFLSLSVLMLFAALGTQVVAQNNGPGGVSSIEGPNSSTSNLGLWLIPESINLNSQGNVSGWTDRSGKANNASAFGNGEGLTVSTNSTFNNKRVVNFNGGQFLRIPDNNQSDNIASFLDGGNGLTVYTVISGENLAGTNQYFISKPDGNNPNTSPYKMYFENGNTNFDVNQNTPAVSSQIAVNDPFNYLLSFQFTGSETDDNGNNVFTYINGNDDATASNSINDNTLNNNGAPLFIGSRSGNNGAGANKFTGQMAEIILFNRDLNVVERVLVDNYLSSKYGVNIDQTRDYYAFEQFGYDQNVFGVGQLNSVSKTSSTNTRLNVRVDEANLNDGDFIMIGNNGLNSDTQTCAVSDDYSRQTNRAWRFDNRNGAGQNPSENNISNFTLRYNFRTENPDLNTNDVAIMISDNQNFTNPTYINADALADPSDNGRVATFNLDNTQLMRGNFFKFAFGRPIVFNNGSFANGNGPNNGPNTGSGNRKLIIMNGEANITNNASVTCVVIKDGATLTFGNESSYNPDQTSGTIYTDGLPTLTVSNDIRLNQTGLLDAQYGNITFNGPRQQIVRDSESQDENDNIELRINNLRLTSTKADDLVLNTDVGINGRITILGGRLVTNDRLVMRSNANRTAVVSAVGSAVQNPREAIIGKVTVERFIPAKRAFRLVSSPVDSDMSINENWQEGVHNTAVSGANFNKNPNPGFGTHITGSTTGQNGLDATPSGNPSLFTYNNTALQWNPVINTDTTTLEAGKPYRLFVRGSRGVDVTNNQTTPIDTRLRMRGRLFTGDTVFNEDGQSFNNVPGAFIFVGNPYQAQVDMTQVLNSTQSSNIDDNNYTIYDPTINERGAYVTINLTDGGTTFESSQNGSVNGNPSSDATTTLQPNQAFFVQTGSGNDSPTVRFRESFKIDSVQTNDVFNVNMDPMMRVLLYKEGFEKAVDGLMVHFNESNNDGLTTADYRKMPNLDENLAINKNGEFVTIEEAGMPEEGRVIQLYNDNYRAQNYSLKVKPKNMSDATMVLNDNYLNTQTEIDADGLDYSFSVDPNEAASSASDRFSIEFVSSSLSTDNPDAGNLALYPNPTTDGKFSVQLNNSIQAKEAQVEIFNINGQRVYQQTYKNAGNVLQVNPNSLATGVYLTKVTVGNQTFEQKLIVK